MKPILFFCVCILFVAGSCKNDTTENKNDPPEIETQTQPKVDQQKLKSDYKKFSNKRTNWYPSAIVYETGKVNPVDEARKDTAFFVFREALLEAIEQKDVFYLLDKTAADVKCSFGSENGVAGFVNMWHLDSPEGTDSSLVWATLKSVLTKGGVFSDQQKRFTAPYYFDLFPDKYDGFTHGVILGKGVRMRESANLRSKVVKSLSFDVIEVVGESDKTETIRGETHPWVQVKLLDGRAGYVWGKFIGSPIGFRAGFSRQENGEWEMDLFVSGD